MRRRGLIRTSLLAALAGVLVGPLTGPAAADHRLEVRAPAVVSNPDAGIGAAHKVRILRLADGTLVVAYADRADPDGGHEVWDLTGARHPVRDIYLRYSRDNALTWSPPLNVSRTAGLADIFVRYDPDGTDTNRQPYYGDSAKPNLFAPGNGNRILITWIDRWCGSGLHGVARYPAQFPVQGEIEVPFACLYAARLVNTASGVDYVAGGGPEQLTDASRDALQDLPRGTGAGFAIAWQEDPLGLQPGEAEGPGDGGTGAKVSHGTDIWYTFISMADFLANAPWSTPVPISDNGPDGNTGASRPNMAIVKSPGTPAQTVLVYEETKGSGGTLIGKNVILHGFRYDRPPTAQAGTIISDPLENSRRARIVAKSTPGPVHGTRMIVFWRQGLYGEGGPADIMARIGRVPDGGDFKQLADPTFGLRVEDLDPPVDSQDPSASQPALNLSASRLDEASDGNPIEDARAHRALLVGDAIAFGYTYTPDQPVARYTDYRNYNYFVRRSLDGGRTWGPPRDVSAVTDTTINVVEPRMVGTPGTVADSPRAEDLQDPSVFHLAWGTQRNQYEATAGPRIDLDLYLTRTVDFGATYEPVLRLALGEPQKIQNGELQLRSTPDGNRVFAVWMHTAEADKRALAASAKLVPASASAAGCTLSQAAAPDPVLPALVLGALWLVHRRESRVRAKLARACRADPFCRSGFDKEATAVRPGLPPVLRSSAGADRSWTEIEHVPRRGKDVLHSQS